MHGRLLHAASSPALHPHGVSTLLGTSLHHDMLYGLQYKHLERNHHTVPNPLARGKVDLGALIDGVSHTPW